MNTVAIDFQISTGQRVTSSALSPRSLADVVEIIRNPPRWLRADSQHVAEMYAQALRETGGQGAAWQQSKRGIQDFKRKALPYFCPGGTFANNERDKDGWLEASGLISADVDGVSPEEAVALRDTLAQHPACVLAFLSPSRHGVKALYHIGQPERLSNEEHHRLWHALADWMRQEYGLTIDLAAKDCSRACYLAADEGAHFNPEAEVLDLSAHMPEEPQEAPIPAHEPKAAQEQAERLEPTEEEREGIVARALAYVMAMPESIEGTNGSAALLAVCRALVSLDDASRWEVLTRWNDERASPPWSREELERAVANVAQEPNEKTPPCFDWPEPPSLRALAKPPPFDVETMIPSNLPWLRSYIAESAQSLSVSPDWPALLSVTVASMAALGAVEVEIFPGYREPPCLFLVGLAEPSQRKSAVFGEFLRPMHRWDDERQKALLPVRERHLGMIRKLQNDLKKLEDGKGVQS
ncbi:MAG: DUF3987 domain-containing protein [Planctomycetota bacterium]|nr:MAG: DUF3987 domain-containing protein [Planctomycetota bacterium]